MASLAAVVGMLALTACLPDASYTEVPANQCQLITARSIAQTFKANSSGELDKVSAVLGPYLSGDPDIAPITIRVMTTGPTGLPTGEVIGSGAWSGPLLPDVSTFADIPLTTPAVVTAGSTYALVFTNTDPMIDMCLYVRNPGTYADGTVVLPNPAFPYQWGVLSTPLPGLDALFKTWVTQVPDASYEDVPANDCRLTVNNLPELEEVAQTFEANTTGTLNKVSAILGTYYFEDDPADAPITITVQSLTPQGAPSGVVLGTGTWAGPRLPNTSTFADITLTTPASITAGTSYALVFTNTDPLIPMCVWATTPGTYADGQLLTSYDNTWTASGGTDAPFKAWVIAS